MSIEFGLALSSDLIIIDETALLQIMGTVLFGSQEATRA